MAVLIDPEWYFIVDIDNHLSLSDDIKKWPIENEDTVCLCYHHYSDTDLSYETVLNTRPFKLFFKCNLSIKNRVTEILKALRILQIEIGLNKAFTVAGFHQMGKTTYRILGGGDFNNLELPSDSFIELLEKLVSNIDLNKESIQKDKFILYNMDVKRIKNKFK